MVEEQKKLIQEEPLEETTATTEIFVLLSLLGAGLMFFFGFTKYSNVYLFILSIVGLISALYGLFKAHKQYRYK